jgi:hypothetical protein
MNKCLVHHSLIAIIIRDEGIQCKHSTTITHHRSAHHRKHLA